MGRVKTSDVPDGMEGVTEAEIQPGNQARAAFEQIISKVAEVSVKMIGNRGGNRTEAKLAAVYNSLVAMNGAQRYLAAIIGYHGQAEQADDLEQNINEGSMMLSSMMLATMCREVGGSTQVFYDIQLLKRSVERAELVLGRPLDGEVDPDILKAVRTAEDFLEKHGLTFEAMEAARDERARAKLQ